MEEKFKVVITEYERGWGSRVDSIEEFDTKELAEDYIKRFNEPNNKEVVPDWYMVASALNF